MSAPTDGPRVRPRAVRVPGRSREAQRPRVVRREQGSLRGRTCSSRRSRSSRTSPRGWSAEPALPRPIRARPAVRCSGSTATRASPRTRRRTRPTRGCTSGTRAPRTPTLPASICTSRPTEVFAGGGIWHPDTPTVTRIRQAIVADPERWRAATREPPFSDGSTRRCDNSLKRVPTGFDPRARVRRRPPAARLPAGPSSARRKRQRRGSLIATPRSARRRCRS